MVTLCRESALVEQELIRASPKGGIIEPTASQIPGKPGFGLLGWVSGG
jgi:hypothetical protein